MNQGPTANLLTWINIWKYVHQLTALPYAASIFQSLDSVLCPFLLSAEEPRWYDAKGFWQDVGVQSTQYTVCLG